MVHTSEVAQPQTQGPDKAGRRQETGRKIRKNGKWRCGGNRTFKNMLNAPQTTDGKKGETCVAGPIIALYWLILLAVPLTISAMAILLPSFLLTCHCFSLNWLMAFCASWRISFKGLLGLVISFNSARSGSLYVNRVNLANEKPVRTVIRISHLLLVLSLLL